MLSTGDVQGCLRKLETLLRVIKYPGCVDYNGLSKGDPSAFLPIVSFTLTSFSPPFAEQLMAAGLELTGKTDLRFTDALYKVLRDIFHYKPILNKQQFLQWGFSQRKISVICDIINLVLQRHKQLKKVDQHKASARVLMQEEVQSRSGPATHAHHREQVELGFKFDQPKLIIRPLIQEEDLSRTDPATKSIGQHFREHVDLEFQPTVTSLASHKDDGGEAPLTLTDADILSGVEVRLSALEARIEKLLSGLDRIKVLEKRLEELERLRNTDKTPSQNEEEVITISKESWENVMSRVLLLETKLELSNTKTNAPPPSHPPSSSSATPCSSTSTSVASKGFFVQEDIKDRLESITNMLKTTSSLLKNTDSSTTP